MTSLLLSPSMPPPLDIIVASTQPAPFHNNLSSLLPPHPLLHSKVFSFLNNKNPTFPSKPSRFPQNLNPHHRTAGLLICAVATLEPKPLLHKEDGHNGRSPTQLHVSSDPSLDQLHSHHINDDSAQVDDREQLRRMRISKANKGKSPWNKGRKHSAETLQRIKERTWLAMQDPKVKMKLVRLGHAQSKETRNKIAVGVRMRWRKRREKRMAQETCYYEWQNLIAEASRRGYVGEEELQWDSYKILSEKIELEWNQSIEQRKMTRRPKGSKRAPKSLEQRRKIAEAIAAKWADPEYRERVYSGMARYRRTKTGAARKPRQKPSDVSHRARRDPPKKRTSDRDDMFRSNNMSTIQRVSLQRSKTPSYKDPLASSKLQMIKKIRAQRAANETKKTEAIERARLLIAESQKAARSLEVASSKSPIARASLMEIKKLIAEAIQLIECIDGSVVRRCKENEGEFRIMSAVAEEEEEGRRMGREGSNEAEDMGGPNGTKVQVASKDEVANYLSRVSMHELAAMGNEQDDSRYGLPSFKLELLMGEQMKGVGQLETNGRISLSCEEKKAQPNGCMVKGKVEVVTSSKSGTTIKKWVRGRLVEETQE